MLCVSVIARCFTFSGLKDMECIVCVYSITALLSVG